MKKFIQKDLLSTQPLKCVVVGASGYAGAQLVSLIGQHPLLKLVGLAVSESSEYLNVQFKDVYPEYALGDTSQVDDKFHAYSELVGQEKWKSVDVVFLATPHEWSAAHVPEILAQNKVAIDLSGAFRLKCPETFQSFYQFPHPGTDFNSVMHYGLPELRGVNLAGVAGVAVAGCYPTAAILSIAPLAELGLIAGPPVINAVSGVSGAGRKSTIKNSFCEVSLQAYGIDQHRHSPEIEQALDHDVIFTPHLGNYKRGILSTSVVPVKHQVTQQWLEDEYQSYYSQAPLVDVVTESPRLQDVVHTPKIRVFPNAIKNGHFVEVVSVIDNLMKGAASSAIQCLNLQQNWPIQLGLIPQNLIAMHLEEVA